MDTSHMMPNQRPSSAQEPHSLDTDLPADGLPALNLPRHDTSSSTVSAKPIPTGNWTLNISGNCPGCHHHHNSVKIHVKATSDSSHIGDVYCENCQRLWLGLGKRSSTRFSLVSTKTIEVNSLEKTFRSTLVQMMRSATAIAALSPTLGSATLADIPESSSPGPSRETSIRSITQRGIQKASSITGGSVAPGHKDLSSSSSKAGGGKATVRPFAQNRTLINKDHTTGTPQLILRVRQKIGAKFPVLKRSPLGRWFLDQPKLSPKQQGKQPIRETLPSPVPAPISILHPVEVETEEHNDLPKQHNLNICSSSTRPQEALDSLKAMDQKAIKELSPGQRIAWMREQVTAFKSLTRQSPPPVISTMVDSGTQVDTPDILPVFQIPPSRRHSALAFVGNRFGSFQYWEIFRGSNSTPNRRQLSMSETHLSDADTAVEGMSATSAPRRILLESMQRGQSPRPDSFHSGMHNWQHILHHRVETRESFDSRSITPARGRARNRLSRASGRTSTIYVTEPSISQVQLAQPTTEQSERSGDPERRSSTSELPSSY